MTTHTDDLPKSYIIKQLRSNLNKTYHIEKTQGIYPKIVSQVFKIHCTMPSNQVIYPTVSMFFFFLKDRKRRPKTEDLENEDSLEKTYN